MPSPRPQSLPVFLLIRTAYQFFWRHRDDALRLGLIPTLICFGGLIYGGDAVVAAANQFQSGSVDQMPSGTYFSAMATLFIVALASSLAIANWLRFMLLGPMAAVGLGFAVGRPHVAFIITCAVLWFSGSIAFSVLCMPALLLPGILKAIGVVVVFIVVIVLITRLLPFAVAQAIGQPISLQQAWAASRGNGVPLATALILVQMPMWIGASVLKEILWALGFASMAPLAMLFITAVLEIANAFLIAIVLATAFRQMVGIRV